MADETIRTRQEMLVELERSREHSARLLDALAQRIGAKRAVRGATNRIERAAHYVQVHSMKDVVTGFDRIIRRRPASSIAVAVLAGFILGRTLGSNRSSR